MELFIQKIKCIVLYPEIRNEMRAYAGTSRDSWTSFSINKWHKSSFIEMRYIKEFEEFIIKGIMEYMQNEKNS